MQTKLLFAIVVIVALVVCSNAQRSSELQWRVYIPPRDEFTVESPFNLNEDGGHDPKAARKYYGSINGIYVFAFSDPIGKSKQFETVKKFVSEAGTTSLMVPEMAFVPTTVSFQDQFAYFNVIVVVRTVERLYTFQTVSEKQNNPIARKFLSSIQFDRKALLSPDPEQSADPEATKASEVPVKLEPPRVPSGYGQGSGSGNGSGGTTPSSPVASLPSSPLKVLSKPRAAYTDLARFYQIEGSLTLKVTLLASGEVGSINVVSRLPFGLTQNAVAAARAIRFEPKKINGVPVSTILTFIYSFDIY